MEYDSPCHSDGMKQIYIPLRDIQRADCLERHMLERHTWDRWPCSLPVQPVPERHAPATCCTFQVSWRATLFVNEDTKRCYRIHLHVDRPTRYEAFCSCPSPNFPMKRFDFPRRISSSQCKTSVPHLYRRPFRRCPLVHNSTNIPRPFPYFEIISVALPVAIAP